MPPDELSGPDLDGVVADANRVGLPYVVIGGFSDGAVLGAADISGAHHLRVSSRHGIVDIMRGGLAPLDYETVAARAVKVEAGAETAPFASLRSLVGFKRLAGRSQDRLDLENLERVHGELPIDPIPGLDS
jgi:hypothetical protein